MASEGASDGCSKARLDTRALVGHCVLLSDSVVHLSTRVSDAASPGVPSGRMATAGLLKGADDPTSVGMHNRKHEHGFRNFRAITYYELPLPTASSATCSSPLPFVGTRPYGGGPEQLELFLPPEQRDACQISVLDLSAWSPNISSSSYPPISSVGLAASTSRSAAVHPSPGRKALESPEDSSPLAPHDSIPPPLCFIVPDLMVRPALRNALVASTGTEPCQSPGRESSLLPSDCGGASRGDVHPSSTWTSGAPQRSSARVAKSVRWLDHVAQQAAAEAGALTAYLDSGVLERIQQQQRQPEYSVSPLAAGGAPSYLHPSRSAAPRAHVYEHISERTTTPARPIAALASPAPASSPWLQQEQGCQQLRIQVEDLQAVPLEPSPGSQGPLTPSPVPSPMLPLPPLLPPTPQPQPHRNEDLMTPALRHQLHLHLFLSPPMLRALEHSQPISSVHTIPRSNSAEPAVFIVRPPGDPDGTQLPQDSAVSPRQRPRYGSYDEGHCGAVSGDRENRRAGWDEVSECWRRREQEEPGGGCRGGRAAKRMMTSGGGSGSACCATVSFNSSGSSSSGSRGGSTCSSTGIMNRMEGMRGPTSSGGSGGGNGTGNGSRCLASSSGGSGSRLCNGRSDLPFMYVCEVCEDHDSDGYGDCFVTGSGASRGANRGDKAHDRATVDPDADVEEDVEEDDVSDIVNIFPLRDTSSRTDGQFAYGGGQQQEQGMQQAHRGKAITGLATGRGRQQGALDAAPMAPLPRINCSHHRSQRAGQTLGGEKVSSRDSRVARITQGPRRLLRTAVLFVTGLMSCVVDGGADDVDVAGQPSGRRDVKR